MSEIMIETLIVAGKIVIVAMIIGVIWMIAFLLTREDDA